MEYFIVFLTVFAVHAGPTKKVCDLDSTNWTRWHGQFGEPGWKLLEERHRKAARGPIDCPASQTETTRGTEDKEECERECLADSGCFAFKFVAEGEDKGCHLCQQADDDPPMGDSHHMTFPVVYMKDGWWGCRMV